MHAETFEGVSSCLGFGEFYHFIFNQIALRSGIGVSLALNLKQSEIEWELK